MLVSWAGIHTSPYIHMHAYEYIHRCLHPSGKHPDGLCGSQTRVHGCFQAVLKHWKTFSCISRWDWKNSAPQWRASMHCCWLCLVGWSEKHAWYPQPVGTWNCCHLSDDFNQDSRGTWWLLRNTGSWCCSGLLNGGCPSPELPDDMDLGAAKSHKFT